MQIALANELPRSSMKDYQLQGTAIKAYARGRTSFNRLARSRSGKQRLQCKNSTACPLLAVHNSVAALDGTPPI